MAQAGKQYTVAQSVNEDPSETLLQGFAQIQAAVCSLKAENQTLERFKNQAVIMLQQYQYEFEILRDINKKFKWMIQSSFSKTTPKPEIPIPPAAQPIPQTPPPQQQTQKPKSIGFPVPANSSITLTTDVQIKVEGVDQDKFKLRYAISTESVICAVQLNRDGTLMAFADGRTCFLIKLSDGSLVAACEIPGGNTQQEPHTRSIAFSPDNKYIALSGANNSIAIMSIEQKQIIATLDGHTNQVSSLVFTQDSKNLISGGFDGYLMLWDVTKMSFVKNVLQGSQNADPNSRNKDDMIIGFAMAPDNSFIAVAFMTGNVGIFEPSFSQPMSSFSAHQEYLLGISVNLKGSLIATASRDKTVKIWTLSSTPARCKHTLVGHSDYALSAAFSPLDDLIFTASKDESITCWNVDSGAKICSIQAHTNTIFQVVHHPTQKTFVSCGGDGLVCVWDYSL